MGGGPTHAAFVPADSDLQPEIRWVKPQGAPFTIEPTIYSGLLFAPSAEKSIQIISLKTGSHMGEFDLKDFAAGPCLIEDSLLAINEGDEHLIIANWVTGRRIWGVELYGSDISPLLQAGRLFWQDGLQILHCFEFAEGKRIWEKKLEYSLGVDPVADSTNLILAGQQGGIDCLDLDNGDLIWHEDSTLFIRNSPVIWGNTLLVCSANGHLEKRNLVDGTLVWETDAGSPIYAPLATDGEGIYIGTADNKLLRFDFDSGAASWSIPVDAPFKAGATVIGDMAVFAGLNHKVYFVDKNDGNIRFEYLARGMLSARPVACPNRIYVVGEDRNLYCFKVDE